MDKSTVESIVKIVAFARNNNIGFIDSDELVSIRESNANILSLAQWNELLGSSDSVNNINLILSNFEYQLNEIVSGYLSEEEIVRGGIVFTPVYLTDIVVNLCMKYVDHMEIAGDISSGMGAFIYSLNKLIPYVRTRSFEKNEFICDLANGILGNDHNEILNIDTLRDSTQYNSSYDLIVGNPPYVRLQSIDEDTRNYIESNKLYKKYLFGSYDLSVVFIVKIIDLLKENGVAGLVITRKMFSSTYGKKICDMLKEKTQILEIIDFGDNQIFDDKTTYTLIIIFRKLQATDYSFKYRKIPTQVSVDEKNIMKLVNDNCRCYESNVLDVYPWDFSIGEEQSVLRKIEEKGIDVNSKFAIVQGFRTGDNKAFLVNKPGSYVRPYVDGKCIKKAYCKNEQYIIWPYIEKDGKYELIEETELKLENQPAYEHLVTMRDKNKMSGNILEYSRPQNLFAMNMPKIFIKEMMPRAEFAADVNGNMCFGSGYALVPKNEMSKNELIFWTILLSTDIMEFQYRLISTNLHSGWFRMYKGHIEKIVLPDISMEDDYLLDLMDKLRNDIENLEFWNALNDHLYEKFGLSDSEIEYVNKYLADLHDFSLPKYKKKRVDIVRKKNNEYEDRIEDTAYPELSLDEREKYYPVELTKYNKIHDYRDEYRTLVTFQNDKKAPIQRWYKYTQGYSTLLVAKLLDELQAKQTDLVLDPFCGSGTTLLTALNNNISSVGCDVSPLSCWISRIKTYNWSTENAINISNSLDVLERGYDYNYQDLQFIKFFEKAFYPNILAQTVFINRWISELDLIDIEKDFLRLALISIQEEISFIRKHGSHYRFLNDDSHVGVNKLNIELIGEDCDVTKTFKDKVNDMLNDIMMIRAKSGAKAKVICTNILSCEESIEANIVITSPPYLNRNNYFSQQKIELSLLQLVTSQDEYNNLVKQSFCSHVEAKLPEHPICKVPEVNKIIEAVTKRKSNNAKIPHMIAGYFNDIDSFFDKLPKLIKKETKVAVVVANCRWNGVVIPVDHLVCRIAEQYGFKANKIIVARMKGNSPQQMQEFGKIPVRESIVVLSYD